MYCRNNSSPILGNVTISANTASNSGGGLYLETSNPIIDNLFVQNNSAFRGGGITCYANSSPTLKNISISANSSSHNGGGIWITNYSNPSLLNVSITNNSTGVDGGGGLDIDSNSNPTLTNVTISGNTSDTPGGGLQLSGTNCHITLVNSMMWNNSPQEIYFDETSTADTIEISYSNVAGGQDSIVTNDNSTITWGNGNIDVDPHFLDAENDDYHLLASSQCINAGHPDSLDSDGTVADIGVYPYLNSYSGPTWYITEEGNDTTATGASDDPFRSIQAGINFSFNTDSVTVAAGTYVENINFRGRNIKVVGTDEETTIIDGDSSGSVVLFIYGEDSTAVLSGFTITNGLDGNGGGIFCSSSSPRLYDLIIENNITVGQGGGIYLWYSTPIFSNVIIRNNSAAQGGGIFGGHLDGTFSNIEITNNTANSYGGIEVNHTTSLTLVNVTISGNISGENGSNSFGASTVNIINSIILMYCWRLL